MTSYARLGGRTVARFKGAEVAYLHTDHLGSPVAATDETGAILWAEHFTPYGESIPGPAANPDDEGFTGHIRDAQTDMIYMQARYMDPVVGRFLSNDPVGFASGGVDYFNRYAYTANDPINAIDPDGRKATIVRKGDKIHITQTFRVSRRNSDSDRFDLFAKNAAAGLAEASGGQIVFEARRGSTLGCLTGGCNDFVTEGQNSFAEKHDNSFAVGGVENVEGSKSFISVPTDLASRAEGNALQHVLAHEVGHGLGLEHNGVSPENLMGEESSGNKDQPVGRLSADEIDTIINHPVFVKQVVR